MTLFVDIYLLLSEYTTFLYSRTNFFLRIKVVLYWAGGCTLFVGVSYYLRI